MSNKPVESILDAAATSDTLAGSVEVHLDTYPIEVREEELALALDRLEARIAAEQRPRMSPWPFLIGLAAVAAGSLLVLRADTAFVSGDLTDASPLHQAVVVPPPPVVVHTSSEGLDFSPPGRRVELVGPARVLSASDPRSAVVLVQEGTAQTDEGTEVEAGQWALLTRDKEGTAHTVVFPDGASPPPLSDDIWGATEVDAQLRAVRWETLPERTHDAIQHLFEEKP